MFQKHVDANHSIVFKTIKKEIKIEVKGSVEKHVNKKTNAYGFPYLIFLF
jgi:hypothetical protein